MHVVHLNHQERTYSQLSSYHAYNENAVTQFTSCYSFYKFERILEHKAQFSCGFRRVIGREADLTHPLLPELIIASPHHVLVEFAGILWLRFRIKMAPAICTLIILWSLLHQIWSSKTRSVPVQVQCMWTSWWSSSLRSKWNVEISVHELVLLRKKVEEMPESATKDESGRDC